MSVETRLKQRLNELGHSQSWLAKSTNVHRSQISRTFSNRREVTLREYVSLCRALEVCPVELLKFADD